MMTVLVKNDADLQRLVRVQLDWDARLEPSDIDVTVDDGKAVLSGTVTSFAARQIAEEDTAGIDGIRSVENLIAVKFPARAEHLDDARIASVLRSLLHHAAGIDESRITVTAVAGLAILEGTVGTFWEKVRAEALAAEVNGVTGIRNDLAVVPTRDVLDEVIAQDITAALARNLAIDLNLLNVEVDSGRVILSGSVPDRIAWQAAREIAARTLGVREVVVNLVIDRSRQD